MKGNNDHGLTTADHMFILTYIFVVLKLCGVIDWSWWFVVSPIWISTLIIVPVSFIAGLISGYIKSKTK